MKNFRLGGKDNKPHYYDTIENAESSNYIDEQERKKLLQSEDVQMFLTKIKDVQTICSLNKIDLETEDFNRENLSLTEAIRYFYAYFDGFLPRVENYVTLNPRANVVTIFTELLNDFNWENIGETDIEKFFTKYNDPRDDKENILWQPMPISNVSAGPNVIDDPQGWNNNGFDPTCKQSKNGGFWSFADVKGTLHYIYQSSKDNSNQK